MHTRILTKTWVIASTTILAGLLLLQGSAYAQHCAEHAASVCSSSIIEVAAVSAAHRACAQDRDCSVIYLACCPCSGDENTHAVNRQFVKEYEYHCTQAETRACAQRGACAQVAAPVAVCRARQCAVELVPVRR